MSRRAVPAPRAPQPTGAMPPIPRAAVARRAGPEQAQYGGSMDQLAPMAEPQGQKNAIVASHLGSNPPDVVASAVDPDELADAPRPKVWVVEAEKRVSMNGQLFVLRAGKEIDENNYNIDALRKQGVKLHPLEQSA